MKAKDVASLKLAAGEAKVQDMASEMIVTEHKLWDLKEKKGKLDTAVGKLRLDIIKAESKLSKKQAQHREKLVVVEGARKVLAEAQFGKKGMAQ